MMLRHQAHCPALNAFNPVSCIDDAELLQPRVGRPVSNRPLIDALNDVDESSCGDHALQMRLHNQGFAGQLPARHSQLVALVELVALDFGPVVGLYDRVDLGMF